MERARDVVILITRLKRQTDHNEDWESNDSDCKEDNDLLYLIRQGNICRLRVIARRVLSTPSISF